MYGTLGKGLFKHRTYQEKGQYQYHNNDNKRFVYYSNNLWLHLTDVQVFHIYTTILLHFTMIMINFGMACNSKTKCCRGFGSDIVTLKCKSEVLETPTRKWVALFFLCMTEHDHKIKVILIYRSRVAYFIDKGGSALSVQLSVQSMYLMSFFKIN